MKKFLILFSLILSLTIPHWGCGMFGGGGQPPGTDPNPGDPNFEILQIFWNVIDLGFFPNRIKTNGTFAYIVNSGSNNIQRVNLINGESNFPWAILPVNSNPWDITFSGNKAYVSNFVTNTVSVFNLSFGGPPMNTILPNAFGGLVTPEGMAASSNGFVFVANPNLDFSGGQTNYGPGFITVIDTNLDIIVNEIPTTQQNPQFIHAIGNTVYVTNSGEFQFSSGCNCFVPQTDGGIDIIDATQADVLNAPSDNIPIPLDGAFPFRGIPGSFAPTLDNNFAYLGSNSGIIYKVDLLNQTLVRGNSNPIFVTADEHDNLINVKSDPEGIIWVLSFNEDLAYLLNFNTDEIDPNAISLNSDANNLEGPLDIGFLESGDFPDAYILMSLSRELSAVITN